MIIAISPERFTTFLIKQLVLIPKLIGSEEVELCIEPACFFASGSGL